MRQFFEDISGRVGRRNSRFGSLERFWQGLSRDNNFEVPGCKMTLWGNGQSLSTVAQDPYGGSE